MQSRPAPILLFLSSLALVMMALGCGDAPEKKKSGGKESRGKTGGQSKSKADGPAATYGKLLAAAKASNAADDWAELGAWCEETSYGTAEKRTKIFRRIILIDPDHAVARGKLGFTEYTGEIERFRRAKWLTAEELARARSEEQNLAKHSAKLGADPWYRAAEDLKRELKNDKYLSKFDFEFVQYRPFLIAKERNNASTDASKIRTLGSMLQAAASDFRTTLKSLDLKPLDEVTFRGKPSVLPIIFFEERYTFEKYHLEMGQKIRVGTAAYFMPGNNRIVYFEGEGKGSEQFNLNKMVHELVHQMIWFYTPKRTHCQLHWFQEGIAEFFSGTERKSSTDDKGNRVHTYKFREKLKGRMKGLKFANNDHWFTYRELMSTPDKRAMNRLSLDKCAGDGADATRADGLFYAEAWSLFYFLWTHKGGTYRRPLIKYIGMELDGKTGLSHFREAFEGVDLAKVGGEWRAFVDSAGEFLKDL